MCVKVVLLFVVQTLYNSYTLCKTLIFLYYLHSILKKYLSVVSSFCFCFSFRCCHIFLYNLFLILLLPLQTYGSIECVCVCVCMCMYASYEIVFSISFFSHCWDLMSELSVHLTRHVKCYIKKLCRRTKFYSSFQFL
jgi:hypothetical protein